MYFSSSFYTTSNRIENRLCGYADLTNYMKSVVSETLTF